MLVALVALAAAAAPPGIDDSVVRIQVHSARYDWVNPWRVQPVQSASGSGFVIEGGRVLTNAHVIRDARQILVRRHKDATPFVATIEAIGDDCDLAVLKVADAAFYKGTRPLKLGGLPRLRARVVTYGYPVGGAEVSSTAGIVSRIEFRGYVHSGVDSHLAGQTDAAINPGNSGGPVVEGDQVVGVAFQAMPGFENVGFFIAVPVIRHFLDDLADGRYDGFPDGGFNTQTMISPALRRERGVPQGRSGVVIEAVAPGSSAMGVLHPGDVLVAVDGVTIADDGNIPLGENRVSFAHLLDMKQIGQPARLGIWRDGKEMTVTTHSRRVVRWDRRRNQYGVAPRFLVYAGLVFMPLDAEFLRTVGGEWATESGREMFWHHYFREWEKPATAEREVVVLARVLRHPVNSQMAIGGAVVVDRVNGKPIHALADVAKALAGNTGAFHAFEFESWNGIEALERAKADEAHPQILKRYGIGRDRNL